MLVRWRQDRGSTPPTEMERSSRGPMDLIAQLVAEH
jgi:hypothetical protein